MKTEKKKKKKKRKKKKNKMKKKKLTAFGPIHVDLSPYGVVRKSLLILGILGL